MTNTRTDLLKIWAVGLCFVVWCAALAGESSAVVPLENENTADQDAFRGVKPMDVEGLDRKVADVLTKYYKRTFGGSENWNQIQSVRFDGILHLADGTARFTAFKKKPNYSKVVVFLGKRDRFVLSYDGEDAWQFNTTEAGAEPTAMPADEAKNFIRDATMGGHLMYPLEEGKEISLLDVTTVEGRLCYQVEVKLPDGEQIISCLDVSDFSELSQTTVNAVNGLQEKTIFSDFRYLNRVRFPFASRMLSDGQTVHTVEMQRIRTNLGITPWMFKRSSVAHMGEEAVEDETVDLFEEPINNVAGKDGFGSSESAPGQTAFPDSNKDKSESILDKLDKLSSK